MFKNDKNSSCNCTKTLKIAALSVAAPLLASLGGMAQETVVTASPVPTKKVLIAYYSWGGNTRVIAEQIQKLTSGEIFEIKPKTAYPTDYNACVEQAKREIREGFKPELADKLPDITKYDTIFIGSPNWWSTIAPPVAMFLSSLDLKGKTVIPFVTHGGGGIGRCETDIIKHSPGAKIQKTLYLPGSSVKNAQPEVTEFLKGL